MLGMSDVQRLDGWKTALRALHHQPLHRWLFGWGPETYRSVYRLYRTQEAADLIGHNRVADHVHNLPLELLLTVGLVGTAAFAYFAWCLWRDADEEGRAAMLGLAVMSLVEPIFFPPAAMLALILGSQRRQSCLARPFWMQAGAVFCAAVAIGMWLDDVFPTPRSLILHPHESEANQLAIVDALQAGRNDLAVFYAQRAVKADPAFTELAAEEARFEAAVRARRASLPRRPRP